MKLFLLTAVVMTAFAANSLLNRAALAADLIDPMGFALVRVLAGAVMLGGLLAAAQGGRVAPARPNLGAVGGLTLYLLGFSLAYTALDTGLGALILFGGVQVTMFVAALALRERVPARKWLGMGISMSGLVLLLWPTEAFTLPIAQTALMAAAAIGWGIYSIIGRTVQEPLAATFWNFVYAVPLVAGAWILLAPSANTWTGPGIALATASGALASGLGYALWYKVLPQLGASTAALAQLSVPIIAAAMGTLLLGEAVSLRMAIATALVLGGIWGGLARSGRAG